MEKNKYWYIDILFIIGFVIYGSLISYGLINWTYSYVVCFPFMMFLFSLFVRECYQKYTIMFLSMLIVMFYYYLGLLDIVLVQPELNREEIVAELDFLIRNTYPYLFYLPEPEKNWLLRDGISDVQFMWELEKQHDLLTTKYKAIEIMGLGSFIWIVMEFSLIYAVYF